MVEREPLNKRVFVTKKAERDMRTYTLEKTIKIQYTCCAHNLIEAKADAESEWNYDRDNTCFDIRDKGWQMVHKGGVEC